MKPSTHPAHSIRAVVLEGNCMGCGTCEAICPEQAVRVRVDEQRGVYRPEVNTERCTECRTCLTVCPGRGAPLEKLAGQFLDADRVHERFGRYRALGLGQAVDADVRFRGSSGGLVTALLLYALETKQIDGALVLGHEPDNGLRTRPFIARTAGEIREACGSKYCPAAANRALREIAECPGTYAVVGLPCHIHAVRKWQARDPRLKDRIRYVLGLFCTNASTYLGTEYFLWSHRIAAGDVDAIRYRARGWPGELEVQTRSRTFHFPGNFVETNRCKQALRSSAFHFDFMIPRCLVCPDQTAELADISFADPHLPEMRARYHDGISWAIVRTSAAARLLRSACDAGCIRLEEFPEDQAMRAQNYGYKAQVGGRMERWRAMGRPAPDFGREYAANRSMVRRARIYRWSFWSHHRWTWPVLWISCATVRRVRAWLLAVVGPWKKALARRLHR